MKKLLLCAAMLACLTGLSGCGGKEEKTVTCDAETIRQQGFKFDSKAEFKYIGTLVTEQIENTTITFETEEIYKAMKPYLEESSKEKETKDMKGVSYKLEFDDKKMTVKERLDIKIKEVSAASYAQLTGLKESDLKGMKIGIKETRENMIKDKYKCSAID